jgi:regulator of RNase E activity RraB
VNELIEKFTQKVEKFEEDKNAWGTYVEEEEAEHEGEHK